MSENRRWVEMLNEIQEFLDYTTPVTYSANAKADTALSLIHI